MRFSRAAAPPYRFRRSRGKKQRRLGFFFLSLIRRSSFQRSSSRDAAPYEPDRPPLRAADSDGPRENRPTLELAFRSGYVSVGTFDGFF